MCHYTSLSRYKEEINNIWHYLSLLMIKNSQNTMPTDDGNESLDESG